MVYFSQGSQPTTLTGGQERSSITDLETQLDAIEEAMRMILEEDSPSPKNKETKK